MFSPKNKYEGEKKNSDMDNRNLYIGGLAAAITLTAVNYLAHTPLRFAASMIGLTGFIYASKKLDEQFGVPVIFLRRDGPNYWSGAFGGLIGGISGLYGATAYENLTVPEFASNLGLITVFLSLATALLMGTVLQDVKDGYLEVG